MDYSKPFKFIFEDPKWLSKIIITTIIYALPIANLAVFGYNIQLARNVAAGINHPLPSWRNFVAYFVDGIRVSILELIYVFPFLMVYMIYIYNNMNAITQGISWQIIFFSVWMILLTILLVPASIRYIGQNKIIVFFDIPSNLRLLKQHSKLVLILALAQFIVLMIENILLPELKSIAGDSLFILSISPTLPIILFVKSHLLGQSINRVDPELL